MPASDGSYQQPAAGTASITCKRLQD